MTTKTYDVYREKAIVSNPMRGGSTGGAYDCISVFMALPEKVFKIVVVPAGASISTRCIHPPDSSSELILWLVNQLAEQLLELDVLQFELLPSMRKHGYYQAFVEAGALESGKSRSVGCTVTEGYGLSLPISA